MRLIGKTGSSTMTCLCSGTKGGIFDARGCWPVIARKACKSLDCDPLPRMQRLLQFPKQAGEDTQSPLRLQMSCQRHCARNPTASEYECH